MNNANGHFLKKMLGKTLDQRLAEASPVGRRIYYSIAAAVFSFIFSVWIYGVWWQ